MAETLDVAPPDDDAFGIEVVQVGIQMDAEPRSKTLRPRHVVSLVASVFVAVTMTQATARPVQANHMLPSIPTFWDIGNDGVPDPIVGVDADGGSWTQSKLDRLTEATTEWDTKTDWAPYRVVSGTQKVYVDGTEDPGCAYLPGYVAATCVHKTLRTQPPNDQWYDISLVDTVMNPSLPMPYVWWYGSTHTGAENTVDFGGVITHELGHWVYLIDVYGSGCNYGTGMYTMCGEPQNPTTIDDDTWRARGLTTHEVTATNLAY